MTELEPFRPRTELVQLHPSLAERAKDLVAAYQFGEALAKTSFVPKDFKGRPDEAAAAILLGDEVGLSPMQSLRSVYVISGTPAMYARAMVALVMSHGHQVWTEEDTPAKVTVCGQRRGSERVERITWTHDRAVRAKYTSNSKYTTDPQSMLYARASSDVCRRIAPDVLLGLAYSVEEMELSEEPTTSVARSDTKTKVTRRKAIEAPPEAEPEFDDHPQTPAAVEAPSAPSADPEPGSEPDPTPAPVARASSRPVAAVANSSAAAGPPPEEPDPGGVTPTGDRPGMITAAMTRMLFVMLRKVGIGEKDRDLALALFSDVAGRDIDSSKSLTKTEASAVIDRLVEMEKAMAEDVEDAELVEDPADPQEFIDV